MRINKIYFLGISLSVSFLIFGCAPKQKDTKVYQGVVTATIIPAKVIQINQLIENPEPGTSYIGDDKIIFEVDEIPEVMANWTIIEVEYTQYSEPKIIKYTIFSEEKEIEVRNKAVSLSITGDLSSYINK